MLNQVYVLLERLPPPLGMEEGSRFLDIHMRVVDMDLGSVCTFHDVLLGIHDYIYETNHNRQALEERLAIIKAFAVVQRGIRRYMALCNRRNFLRGAHRMGLISQLPPSAMFSPQYSVPTLAAPPEAPPDAFLLGGAEEAKGDEEPAPSSPGQPASPSSFGGLVLSPFTLGSGPATPTSHDSKSPAPPTSPGLFGMTWWGGSSADPPTEEGEGDGGHGGGTAAVEPSGTKGAVVRRGGAASPATVGGGGGGILLGQDLDVGGLEPGPVLSSQLAQLVVQQQQELARLKEEVEALKAAQERKAKAKRAAQRRAQQHQHQQEGQGQGQGGEQRPASPGRRRGEPKADREAQDTDRPTSPRRRHAEEGEAQPRGEGGGRDGTPGRRRRQREDDGRG
jgi:hypothetical protein